MNIFFAYRLEDTFRQRLADFMQAFQAWDLPAIWQDPEDLHLTLCYVGACEDEHVAQLQHKVDLLLSSQCRPMLSCPGVAGFAGKQWPRVIYAAVEDQEQICEDLHNDLHGLCGVQNKRGYVPHLTLCRPQGLSRAHSWQDVMSAAIPFQDQIALKDIALLQTCSGELPRYRCLKCWSFID